MRDALTAHAQRVSRDPTRDTARHRYGDGQTLAPPVSPGVLLAAYTRFGMPSTSGTTPSRVYARFFYLAEQPR